MHEMMINNVVVLSKLPAFLTGAVVGEEAAFSQRLKELTATTKQDIIVDLGGVQHINSYGLGELIQAHSAVLRRGHRFRICNIDKRIENIFIITQLSLVFDVYPDRELALASFKATG